SLRELLAQLAPDVGAIVLGELCTNHPDADWRRAAGTATFPLADLRERRRQNRAADGHASDAPPANRCAGTRRETGGPSRADRRSRRPPERWPFRPDARPCRSA